MPSESFYLKVVAMPIAGLGAIALAIEGVIGGDAAVAVLASMVAFAVGEANGVKKGGVA